MNYLRLCLSLVFSLSAASAFAAGKHVGEADKIQAQIDFLNPYGFTTADNTGTTYNIPAWSWKYHDPSLIYGSQCQGTFPLYIVGMPMSFSVTLTNRAPKGEKPFKIRVEARSNVLETSCSAGQLFSDLSFEVDNLRPGETRTLTYPVNLNDPNLPSGLDITQVRIYHVNDASNQNAALIVEDDALWCPPSIRTLYP